MKVTVYPQSTSHTMQGGIGASWHALIHEVPLENHRYDYPVRHVAPRGSAYGGNPPPANTGAWRQVCDHATWLGLNFIRVELSEGMYQPHEGAFDRENDEMQALYRILDWCEAQGADVFLQRMFGHVEWNAFPGVHPLLSAPRSLEAFAEGLVQLLHHLLRVRGYTCVRYLCMTNEPPGGTWGYWWSAGSHPGPSLTEAFRTLRQALDDAAISIPIAGPDWTSLPPCPKEGLEFDSLLGAFDIHSYFGIHPHPDRIATVGDWVAYAHEKQKPFFITEIGNMNLGWGSDHPGPKSFQASLSNAADIVTCMNLGVDAFNRWSFTNRGDLDGQWQLIRTWDTHHKQYLESIQPEPEAYYGYGILTRFLAKYASVLKFAASEPSDGSLFTACRNTDGSLVLIAINPNKTPLLLACNMAEGHSFPSSTWIYQVTQTAVTAPDFRLDPQRIVPDGDGNLKIKLPPESISVITDQHLQHEQPGRIR
jgi:hypothetical protein